LLTFVFKWRGSIIKDNKRIILLAIVIMVTAVSLIINVNPDHYTGSYKDGKYHGHGRLEFSSGDIFEGYFVEGYAEGYGKFTFSNGEILEGIWEGNHFSGPGRYTFSDGEVWEITTDDQQLIERLEKIEI